MVTSRHCGDVGRRCVVTEVFRKGLSKKVEVEQS